MPEWQAKVREVIDGLIDRVARGGGLLFNFSPKADGSVPEEQKKTMLEMGPKIALAD